MWEVYGLKMTALLIIQDLQNVTLHFINLLWSIQKEKFFCMQFKDIVFYCEGAAILSSIKCCNKNIKLGIACVKTLVKNTLRRNEQRNVSVLVEISREKKYRRQIKISFSLLALVQCRFGSLVEVVNLGKLCYNSYNLE